MMRLLAFVLVSLALIGSGAAWPPGANAPIKPLSSPCGGYVGPGDIKSSTLFWGGLRGYSCATAVGGTNAIQVRRASDNTTQDITILSGGALDTASALTFAGTDATGTGAITGTTLTFTGGHAGDTVTGGTTLAGTYIVSGSSPTWTVNKSQTVASATLTLTWGLFVAKIYNQIGTLQYGHAVQATTGAQPQLMLNGGGTSGSLPWMAFRNAQNLVVTITTGTVSLPVTLSWVGIRTSAFTSYGFTMGLVVPRSNVGFDTIADAHVQYCGTFVSIGSNPDNTWYAVQDTFDGASSVHYSNGTSTSTSPGATDPGSSSISIGSNAAANLFFSGALTEVSMFPAFSGANNIAMNGNQRTYWGF